MKKASGTRFEDWVTSSPAMQRIHSGVNRIRANESPVLLTGESGTGKEVLARAIHRTSPRNGRVFLPVNCAALPEGLLESELFGHRKGAFSGADRDHDGLFVEADGGTLFLDEVGDLPLSLQSKLLRVLEDGEVRPVGSNRSVRTDVRIVSATNLDLDAARSDGSFREDLYYRLRVIAFHLPPLRERPEDVLEMTRVFLLRHGQGRARSIDKEALDWLQSRRWPGNARELENAIQRAIAWTEGRELRLEHFDIDGEAAESQDASALFQIARSGMTLKELDAAYVRCVVEQCQGNKTKAATQLGISRSRLYRHLENEALPDQPLPREGARVGLRSGDRAKLHSNSR